MSQNLSLGTEDGEYYTLSAGLRHSFTPRTVLRLDHLPRVAGVGLPG